MALMMVGFSVTPPSVKADNLNHKVLICHIPPGNPENAHEIEVDFHAVPAHLGHGDTLGFCLDPQIPE